VHEIVRSHCDIALAISGEVESWEAVVQGTTFSFVLEVGAGAELSIA
jgi:hypothetical protein